MMVLRPVRFFSPSPSTAAEATSVSTAPAHVQTEFLAERSAAARTRRLLRSLLRQLERSRPYPRALTPAASAWGISAEATALRVNLYETPFSRNWQPTDSAVVAHSLLYAEAGDLLPMLGARGMRIVQCAWEAARANDRVADDYDAFASRFALWLLERLALLQNGLACPELAPGLVETLRIRAYLETPDRVGTTQIAEAWIRQAEALGLCRLRVRVGTQAELDILLQQDDCALFPVLGIALAGANLESRHATVHDLIQRIVLPDTPQGIDPVGSPAVSASDLLSNTSPLNNPSPNDLSPNDITPSDATLNGTIPEQPPQEAHADEVVRNVPLSAPCSPVSIAPTVSPTWISSTPPMTGTAPASANDIPFPDKPVVSHQVDEAVNGIAAFARDWFGIRAPTAAEREPVRRRMRSTLRQRQEDFEGLYRRLKHQGRLPSIEEFFLTICVHCEIARRRPGMEYSVAAGPVPMRPGIFYYHIKLRHLPTLTVVVKPSRCHSLARLVVLLNPDMREISGAVWSLKRN